MEKCQQPLHSSTNLVTAEQLHQILDERVTAFSIDASQAYLGLCQDHYLAMYRQLHQASPCASCGGRPKKGLVFYRHCPNPEQINGYLNVVSNDPLSLTANSTVCYTCYLYFNRVLKQLQSRGDQIQIPAIDSVVGKLSDSMDDIQVKGEGITRDDYLDLVLCVTGLKLATAMKADEVLLLPELYDFFRSEIVTQAALFPSLGPIPAHDIPGTRWVLPHLSFHFGEMLRVECKHRRFGSLLYHVNCDLLKAVSLALGRNRLHVKEGEQESAVAHPPQVSLSWDEQITSVASYLNDRVHQQAKTFVANFRDSPDKYAAFSIEWLYEAVDPHLIKFVQQQTQSVRNRRRKLFDSESEVTNTRRMRQVYLLCTVLFCAISQCSMPFHTLLTEAILCHGGSQELVRILNQVGAVASLETSHRLATLVVQQRIARGIQPELRHRALCVVSIDNIDILQSHAFVSSTDGTRSWHGTSVQCMQPLPLSAYLTDDEMVTAGRKHPASSPAASPLLVEKTKRRRRTLTEYPSPHTTMTIPETVAQRPLNVDEIETAEYSTQSQTAFNVSEFKPNQAEQDALAKLQGDIFKCMILKYVHGSSDECTLPGLPSLINCVAKQTSNCEVSNVVYVEVLSEVADAKPTLINVLGKLHKTFVVELGQKWLLVVGAAKVFVLLQQIKSEYGSHLSWLLPFPGDWHILFNYQPAFMKPYA